MNFLIKPTTPPIHMTSDFTTWNDLPVSWDIAVSQKRILLQDGITTLTVSISDIVLLS